jgi:phosphate transport system permease protein
MNESAKKSKIDFSRRKGGKRSMSLYAEGEPMVWITGGALGLALLMMISMLSYVFWMGFSNFWPRPVYEVVTHTGETHLGPINRTQTFQAPNAVIDALPDGLRESVQAELIENDGLSSRILLSTGNFDLTGTRFQWVTDFQVAEMNTPDWAITMERRMNGNFFGYPVAFMLEGERVTEDPAEVWALYQQHHPGVLRRVRQRERLRTVEMGRINRHQEAARQDLIEARRRRDREQISDAELAAVSRQTEETIERTRAEHADVAARVEELNQENRRYAMVMRTAQGVETTIPLDQVVLAYPSNQLGTGRKLGIFLERWREFLFDDPREANMEGGVFPAIIGTVTMTLVMTIFVVPFGVLAALYLREYAKPGPIVSAVRIAVNNLAGVPSIVFGVFGLGFFCYIMGGFIDEWFYAARLPAPTFRRGGVLWASSTLALLTLPLVIVATEEALSAVPSSMREGSYACGASKWQTIKRIVLPRAMPGIMTGTILAMARGAGEVAPLMLVGAVKLAPSLPLDIHNWTGSLGPIPTGPIHLERSFMHLGFHIYDLGFQSSDSEAARPMVFTTTLLLITLIVILNCTAMVIRTKLRRKFSTGAF